MTFARENIPTLSQRRWELDRLELQGARTEIRSGRELFFYFSVSPGSFSRVYQCTLHVKTGRSFPYVIVRSPNLVELAGDRQIPHIYPHEGRGTKLCLWWPAAQEWNLKMKLGDTYIPWTVEWLGYFEDWLVTEKWGGGGKHPGDVYGDTSIDSTVLEDDKW